MNTTITTTGYYNITINPIDNTTKSYRLVSEYTTYDAKNGKFNTTTIYGSSRKNEYDAAIDLHTVRHNAYEKNHTVESQGNGMLTITCSDYTLKVYIETI